MSEDPVRNGVALIERVGRDVFRLCANSADALADAIASGDLQADGETACRLLAVMFRSSADKTERGDYCASRSTVPPPRSN